ncbi:MAG: hypothetical protein DMF61_21175 [Blastocatellia bacterium AA13]|nr:MAG: hypothetical protein DMF61_21175 [Blastocatellia bacterium AA13]
MINRLEAKRSSLVIIFAIGLALYLAVAANGRPGGGQTHSSSSSSRGSSSSSSSPSSGASSGSVSSGTSSSGFSSGSSSGSGGSAAIGAIVFIFIIVFVLFVLVVVARAAKNKTTPAPYNPLTGNNMDLELEALKRADPNFSTMLFIDFANKLYAAAHEARGSGRIEVLAPYIYEAAQNYLLSLGSAASDLSAVTRVVIGTSKIVDVGNSAEGPAITVFFESNYTEADQHGSQRSYYAEEQWTFRRDAGLVSLPPGKIDAIHCPKCGGPLEHNETGACVYCNSVVRCGQFHWFVSEAVTLDRNERGPQLTQETEETGTDLPTVYQPNFQETVPAFIAASPGFSWDRMNERVNYIFHSISQAWTTLEWEKARPFETDNIFQMHRYWIEAYQRQQLRNVLDKIQVNRIEWVKVEQDAFYDALTARIWAAEIDYTVDAAGRVVCGSPNKPRAFTEYWTFIRTRGAKQIEQRDDHCPNCAAPLAVNMAGNCQFCGGKVTSGEFDWVLSRIDQDESYSG